MKKVGLALGSGGARGYSHIGVIKFLQKHGIEISYVAGTSIGSAVGAYFALNGNVTGLEKISTAIRKPDLLKLVELNDPRRSLIKTHKIRAFLETVYNGKSFSDTKIPFKAIATNLVTGKRVVFSKGKLSSAVIASSTFPGVFPVVEYRSMHLVDGGLAEAMPIRLVEEMGADVIIGVDLYWKDYYRYDRNVS
ncbi:MAG: patatin family protein, partial [Nanoarchaeota archaeon]|nr:patatin family protein [Nanoarchaeota archaeon]